jgi:GTP cyclohydrolase I
LNAPEPTLLPDVQGSVDLRRIAIARVGVKGITHPVLVATPAAAQPSVASIDMFVALPAEQKGTHMSRFVEILAAHQQPLSVAAMRTLMAEMLQRLEAQQGEIEIRLPYFVRKAAPVSGVRSLMDYQLTLRAVGGTEGTRVWQKVTVPVTSLCPCSKEISDYGAHNQRAHIVINAEIEGELSVDEQIRCAESAASAEMWTLLKRPDEKFVTERAYENPKFVEDVVRDVALLLNREPRVIAYSVESENFESIHNHSAYARVECDKRRQPPG